MAGPVVACLLKQKGYAPIIFERSLAPADVGASLMICPNGLKVLNLIGPGPDWLLQNGPPVLELCDYKASGEVLGRSDVPTEFAKRYGQPAVGVKRTLVTEWLRELAVESGVEVREGWKLEQIQEGEDSVTAFFEGGRQETGCFLVGCDGLKAATRRLLLARGGIEEGTPSFTGLTQVSRLSDLPHIMNTDHKTDCGHFPHARSIPQHPRRAELVRRAQPHHQLPHHPRQDVLGADTPGQHRGGSRLGPLRRREARRREGEDGRDAAGQELGPRRVGDGRLGGAAHQIRHLRPP